MSNQQAKLGLVALVLSAIMVFASAALPAVNALTPSTIYDTRNHKTDRFPGGQHICGETLCTADQWAKMKYALHVAQRDPSRCLELKGWMYCGEPIVIPKTSK
jgi:Spy/CpxP family protein refolding chaperone